MDRIRAFEASDIEQVAALHRTVFALCGRDPAERYRSYLENQFLPQNKDSLSSLVCTTGSGEIVGFLGVAERRFVFDCHPVRAAVSSQFVVQPEARGRWAGIRLMKEFLNGPQDLSFADEANETSQKLWLAMGGTVSTLQGVHWIVPIRPASLAMSRYVSNWLARLANPLAIAADGIIRSLPRSPLCLTASSLTAEPLSAQVMIGCLQGMSSQYRLRPQYGEEFLRGLLARAREKAQYGRLQEVLLRDPDGRVAGWYIYYANTNGLGEVLQIVSRESCRNEVLQHLLWHAWSCRVRAIVSRFEPDLTQALANRLCMLFRRRYAMLIHSRVPEIVCAVQSGRSLISRLDGEWCLRFN